MSGYVRLTEEQALEAARELGLKLGHSHAVIDAMLEKATARQVLAKLHGEQRRRQAQAERKATADWNKKHAADRAEVFAQEQKANEQRLQHSRRQKTLAERVDAVLIAARLSQEGTKGTSFDPRVSTGEQDSPMPSLADRPLVDQVNELLLAVIERAEEDVDRVALCLPRREREERNALILKTRGDAAIVALRYRTSETTVRKLRAAADQHASSGYPLPPKAQRKALA